MFENSTHIVLFMYSLLGKGKRDWYILFNPCYGGWKFEDLASAGISGLCFRFFFFLYFYSSCRRRTTVTRVFAVPFESSEILRFTDNMHFVNSRFPRQYNKIVLRICWSTLGISWNFNPSTSPLCCLRYTPTPL